MSSKIKQFIKILAVSSFFVPLIVIPSSFIFPFIVPKIVIFRSIVLLMLGSYSLLLVSDWQKYKVKLTPINISVALFFLSFTFSTFIGVDPYKSFWDNHERMLGLLTIFHYVVYYFILTTLFKDWIGWRFLFRFFLLAGSILMFIGFIQIYISPEFLLNRGATARVSATLGNAIYFSAYGLFLFFLGLLLALKENKFCFWQIVSATGSFLGFMGIFWGGTRGTFLGLLTGFAVLFFIYVVFLKQAKKIRMILLGLAGLAVLSFGLMFAYRQTPFVVNFPAVGRLFNTDIFSGTANTRFMAWGIAIDAWKEKPVFGWGPNNYFYAFNQYYNPDFLRYGWGETWFDNAHNILVNTLATQGIFGILIYLSLFAISIFSLYKAFKQEKIDLHTFAIPSAFLVAHLVGNVFVFENPTSYLYFFFLLAFVNSATKQDFVLKNMAEIKINRKNISSVSVCIASIIILFLIFVTNIKPAKANMSALETIRSIYNANNPMEKINETLKISSPHIDDIRNDFSRIIDEVLPEYVKSGRKEYAEKLVELTMAELDKNLKLHPLDIRIHIQAIQLLRKIGSQEAIYRSELLIEDALKKSSDRQQLHYIASEIKLLLGKTEEAEKILENSLEENKEINEAWFRIIIFKNYLGEKEEAEKYLNEAMDNGIQFTQQQFDTLKGIFPEVETRKLEN